MRIQSKGFKLAAPFCWSIAKSLDPDAAWQPAFDRCSNEVWREERERYRHVDLAHAAFLTCRDLLNIGHGARNDFVKPATTIASGIPIYTRYLVAQLRLYTIE